MDTQIRRNKRKGIFINMVLFALLLILILVCLCMGKYSISPEEYIKIGFGR